MKKTITVGPFGTRGFFIGTLFGISLVGCAGASFQYKYYYVDLESSKLLGDKPENDLPISDCAKKSDGDHNCVALLKSDFKSLYLEHIDLKNKLSDCERSK